jgi:demethylmenaquinone methyltransferase/2-methoxy-6-polyprenyl-1,4-benzoquinol methylase
VCCGTGDLVRAFARLAPPPQEVIGLDFSAQMLAAGDFANLPAPVRTIQADALDMPLEDASVDVISCAFGVRNFADLQAGLEEMARVARPGGRVVILEFASPANPLLRRLTQFYCEWLLPRMAAWISREKVGAYQYLARSIRTFETPASMRQRLEDAGFEDVRVTLMNLGSVALYRALRPA